MRVARASITLVRDRDGLLPLRLPEQARIAVVLPRPADLTPADTSSYIHPDLAAALRRRNLHIDEFTLPMDPTDTDISGVREQLHDFDLILVGTINASSYSGQAALINALLNAGHPVIPVALRAPYDLRSYPFAGTYLCTYSIQSTSMEALVEVLLGEIQAVGKLPVTI